MKIDVIVTSPYSLDYPLWRQEMQQNRDRFNCIIHGLYQDNRQQNFKDFVIKNTPWALTVDVGPIVSGDWRDVVVNSCLKKSTGDWVLFLEQDFIPVGNFWDLVLKEAQKFDVVGFTDVSNSGHRSYQDGPKWEIGTRLHPAFILVKKKFVNQTKKDFAAHTDKNRDHFGVFTDDLLLNKPKTKFLNLYTIPGWKHYAGISSNYQLVQENKKPNYKIEEFKEFVEETMNAQVVQDPDFIQLCEKCLEAE